jgi:transcriptional regulator of arginine metabolism
MKEDRQRAILELVRERPLHTQQELADALAGRGLGATQATVSRDIQELGLIRTADGYRVGPTLSLVSELVLSMTRVQFLVVIHTPPGTANVVARAIDDAALEGIAGTVAGDDTIIVVLGNEDAADTLRRFLGVEP